MGNNELHMETISGPYDPKTSEEENYAMWEKSGYFDPDKLPGERKENYIVYMPLPNVTGTLHMGHALDNTAPDVLVRYHRMKGDRALWLPGTDHAGIATQYVVEKKLKKEGTTRFKLGREKFIEEVWKWREEYGDRIYGQLKKLGVSADWSRARFTMDEAYAEDVKKAFLHYYEKDLLYRGERTVNWCPRCGTSLSDLELEYEDETAKLWFVKYPIVGEKEKFVIVATTRPETMLGDTAVAVNPKDERYKDLVGKKVLLPIEDREIPIVADEMVDREFGTGAVKITPAHDLADFETGRRHELPSIQVIDERGTMNANAGVFEGMKTEEAREKIVAHLEDLGLLEKEEEYPHRLAKCYRCGHVIEPIPSLQWFLKMEGLAKEALKAVDGSKTRIHPENFDRTFHAWMENIKDWTISRQIWWGHQLPVYFCKNKKEEFVVAIEKPAKCSVCGECEMEQSPDVLDTWFSSALWPFAGLSEEDRKKYYPGNLVMNARDILNLWDARMIFSGLEFMGEAPFKDVLVHGTILTKDGKRMSKSLGTGIDPLKYVDEFGADATRFAVVWQSSGQDIRWDESAVMAGKKFANKIWNAARFVLQQMGSEKLKVKSEKLETPTNADKEIIKKLKTTKEQLEKDIEQFEFAKALHDLYDFFWHDLCDTYLEAAKEQMRDEKIVGSTKEILLATLLTSLKMLHLFMPFVTETIYQKLPLEGKKPMLMIEDWNE